MTLLIKAFLIKHFSEEGIRRQIDWFGSQSFMVLIFGLFFAAMAILIALNP